jgi:hypothetical protein
MAEALPIAIVSLELTVVRGGDLLPWIGPALRGMVARPFKNEVCRFAPAERDTRWVRCTGCPHMSKCAYGQAFEPDAPPGALVERGQTDAVRGVVLHTEYPTPGHVRRGDRLRAQVKWVGAAAREGMQPLLESLARAAQTSGLGPDHVLLEVCETGRHEAYLPAGALPLSPQAGGGTVPRMHLELLSPLFLVRQGGDGRKRPLEQPALVDLVRSSVRLLRHVMELHCQALDVDVDGLEAAAAEAQLLASHFEPFTQRRWSQRGQMGYEMRGTTGWAEYERVSSSLLPWLAWAGLLHIGTHRVSGAGSWRTSESHETAASACAHLEEAREDTKNDRCHNGLRRPRAHAPLFASLFYLAMYCHNGLRRPRAHAPGRHLGTAHSSSKSQWPETAASACAQEGPSKKRLGFWVTMA